MTCITFRDGVIASDSKIVARSWHTTGGFAKCGSRELDGKVYLYGATGETAYAGKFDRWMQSDAFAEFIKTGEGGPNLEPAARDEQCTGLLFHPDNSCTRFEGNYPHYTVTGDYFAFGTGDGVALGALYMGATAQQAVEAAMEHDVLTNGPVQFIDRDEVSLETFKKATMPA